MEDADYNGRFKGIVVSKGHGRQERFKPDQATCWIISIVHLRFKWEACQNVQREIDLELVFTADRDEQAHSVFL